ncbi:MAG TPA: metallophosphoesterase, partial [Tepidisphaeraceae bacterium]|nr:metallophosphoesterase [Tepidisphaeraceae bacterium]
PRWLVANVYIWHFVGLPVAAGTMGLWGLWRGVGLAGRWYGRLSTGAEKTPDPLEKGSGGFSQTLSRRQFLQGAMAATPPVVAAAATGRAMPQLNGFRVRQFQIALPQLPPELEGLSIAHVSDIHVGRFTTGRILQRIVEVTNHLRADLVLLTGDLINYALSDLPAGLDMVRRMDARYGVYMCEGNHDLIQSRRGFEQAVKQSGVPLLINESVMLSIRGAAVQLLGLRWGASEQTIHGPQARSDEAIADSMRVLLRQRRPEAFAILLAHHPHAFDPAADAGIPLTLAGHTHGGQLMATPQLGFGPWMFRYWSGLYEKSASKLVVSNGVGNWFPLRVNAPAEIVHLRLHRAET